MFLGRHEPTSLPPMKEILASIAKVNKKDIKQPRKPPKKNIEPAPAPQRKKPFYGGDKVSRMFSFLPYTDLDIVAERGSDPPYGYPHFAKVVPGTPPSPSSPRTSSRKTPGKKFEPDGAKKKKKKRPPWVGMVYPTEMPQPVDA